MAAKKKPAAFTSFRVIGKRAQHMLQRARESIARDDREPIRPPRPSNTEKTHIVHLSVKSVVQAAFAILAITMGTWLLFHLRHKILLLLLATFIATVVDPGTQYMQRWGVPRGIAILLQYCIALFALVFLIVSFIPIIAIQLQEIARNISQDMAPFIANPQINLPLLSPQANEQLNRLLETTLQNLSVDQFAITLQQAGQNLSDVAQESVRLAARIAGSVVDFLVNTILVLMLAFFMQLEKERIVYWIWGFLPYRYRMYVDMKFAAIHTKIGQWVRGELLLMFSIFLITFIALSILGIDYALTLAVLAGFFELIPAIGPLFAAIPAILIGGTQEGLMWVPILAGVYYAIQWTENNLLVPLIMKRAVGLSPIAVLFAMMVGISFPNTIHPVLGVLLAVPVTTIIALFLEDWRNSTKDEE